MDEVMTELRNQAETAVRLSLEGRGLRLALVESWVVEYCDDGPGARYDCGEIVHGLFPSRRKAKNYLWRLGGRCQRENAEMVIVDVTTPAGVSRLMKALYG